MGAEEELQAMINQTVELAISQKDAYFKEFVFGLIMGQILGLGVAALAQMKMQQGQGNPTPQDQMKVRDMAYKLVPQIRERIFE